MRIRMPLIISFFVIAAMVALSAWAWMVLPPDARIAAHWGLNGRPNGYMPKTVGLSLAPALAFVLSLFFAALPGIEPRRANLLASRKLYLAGWYGTLVILAFTHLFVVRNAMGLPTAGPHAIVIVTALFLIVVGNFLGKSHSNFFVGVRLPWTLSSDLAWEKSNRIAGYGFVATGVATLLAATLVGLIAAVAILTVGVVLSVLVGGIVSYFTWKNDPDKREGSSVHE